MNIDILEVSELKCIGMGEFNSDDHYIYYKWSSYHSQQKCPKLCFLPTAWINLLTFYLRSLC